MSLIYMLIYTYTYIFMYLLLNMLSDVLRSCNIHIVCSDESIFVDLRYDCYHMTWFYVDNELSSYFYKLIQYKTSIII